MTKKVVGKALYLEMRRDTEVCQAIFTPELNNPLRVSRIKPYSITRNLKSDTKRKSWRYSSGPRVGYDVNVQSMKEVFDVHGNQFRWIAPMLIGFHSGGWKVYKTPLIVEMSTDDAIDIIDKKTPSALVRRIMKARATAGFPESLQVELPYIPTA